MWVLTCIVGIMTIVMVVGGGIFYYLLNQQGGFIMASLLDLQAKVDELIQAGVEREARDIAQDAVTQQQIALLQITIDELRAIIVGGGLSPENQAIVDASILKVQATIDSLNAADPTAPIV